MQRLRACVGTRSALSLYSKTHRESASPGQAARVLAIIRLRWPWLPRRGCLGWMIVHVVVIAMGHRKERVIIHEQPGTGGAPHRAHKHALRVVAQQHATWLKDVSRTAVAGEPAQMSNGRKASCVPLCLARPTAAPSGLRCPPKADSAPPTTLCSPAYV